MELGIEAASDEAGVALSVDGVVGLMAAWHTERNHSVELLPNVERLLAEAGRTKADLSAIFVDVGPGGYAGLRVGVSIAKGLSHGLGIPIVGVGRLELDAYAVRGDAGGRRIVAAHRAGRGDRAWAAYSSSGGWHEESAPTITAGDAVGVVADDVVTGDVNDDLAAMAQRAGASVVSAQVHRVVVLAALGHERLIAGRADDAASLVPLYLRAPAIGAQR